MDTTIVSLTGCDGKTVNTDYKDCHIPTDDELLELAKRSGLKPVIKATITSVLGDKTKFAFTIENGKMVKTTDVKKNNSGFNKLVTQVISNEILKITEYRKYQVDIPTFLKMYNLTEQEVENRVSELRTNGIWKFIPERYSLDMFVCVMFEMAAERNNDGTIQAQTS